MAEFDELVAEVMAEWRTPGLAMAVVRRGEVPLLRCWGVRDIDTGAPVTADTVFSICSVTKSFTATALALLVDEGKLEWDWPAREYLPEFRLRDPVAFEQASLHDLLTHRTGLPRHDWVHMGGQLDNAGMLATLRQLEPSKPFRSTFQYNNLMYLVRRRTHPGERGPLLAVLKHSGLARRGTRAGGGAGWVLVRWRERSLVCASLTRWPISCRRHRPIGSGNEIGSGSKVRFPRSSRENSS